jgi:hypothetical protein
MPPDVPFGRHAAVPLLALLLAANSLGQQTHVTRFDLFTGYASLNSPRVGLVTNGFQTQFGVRPWTWMSFGFDYSVSQGDLTITPNLLLSSIQQGLGAQLAQLAVAGKLPPGYALTVPASSTTQTFAGGPQLAYRHFKQFTLFVRPSCGIIHETATPHAGDPIAAAIVAQLAPTGQKHDTTKFLGVGGGIDLLFSKHVALRMQGDFVRDHLFNDLLNDPRNTVRLSVGPCFNFGRNIAEK